MIDDPTKLPAGLPVPIDDGACDHLGRGGFEFMPSVGLPSTDGSRVTTGAASPQRSGSTVLFFYPRTGVPGQPPSRGFGGEDWDEIAGARGCTPQSCGFRDAFAEFRERGVSVFGVSTNTTEHQLEFKRRMHIPFEFLSDSGLELTRALRLPTFEFPVESGGPTTLVKRMAMLIESDGRISKVWYPVFPPDQNAAHVLHWLKAARPSEPAASDPAHRPTQPAWRAGPFPTIRPAETRDLTWVRRELLRNWHATQISSRGVWFDADRLPAFIAEMGVERAGLVTYTEPEPGGECEVVTLSSGVPGAGVGAGLLDAVVRVARRAGVRRAFLTTTNDNLYALGFYQRQGWSIAALHRGAMDTARLVKPTIPLVGMNSIPLRDEIELELRLTPASGDAGTDVR